MPLKSYTPSLPLGSCVSVVVELLAQLHSQVTFAVRFNGFVIIDLMPEIFACPFGLSQISSAYLTSVAEYVG